MYVLLLLSLVLYLSVPFLLKMTKFEDSKILRGLIFADGRISTFVWKYFRGFRQKSAKSVKINLVNPLSAACIYTT